jgi:hypothetical protein
MPKPVHCCFCSENESISYLFLECDIAKAIWCYASDFLGFEIGSGYISVASRWQHKEKNYIANNII